jgi:hypothetical protein
MIVTHTQIFDETFVDGYDPSAHPVLHDYRFMGHHHH